jgi:AraC family L-rhamnose operon transcriptional activator RhaR
LAALRHPRDWIDQLESEALAFSLLAFGLRSTAVDPPSSVARPIAGRIERLLKQPDAVTWTPRELARKAGLQSDYLNRRLKQETGRSLQQWRASERLLRAKRSLSQGRPIAEAAAQAGFQDVNYFCRWFRLQTDETPGTYRHRTTVQ